MKNLKTLFGLFVIVAAIFCGWKMLPPYMAYYQFEEAMDDVARTGAVDSRKSLDDLRSMVLKEANGVNLNLNPDQIQVQRIYNDVLIWGDYTVRVDMPVYPFDLHFHPASKSKKRAM
jgi:hypothetical protein